MGVGIMRNLNDKTEGSKLLTYTGIHRVVRVKIIVNLVVGLVVTPETRVLVRYEEWGPVRVGVCMMCTCVSEEKRHLCCLSVGFVITDTPVYIRDRGGGGRGGCGLRNVISVVTHT
jgi:hypothetical protein